jgi:hypothetical protein
MEVATIDNGNRHDRDSHATYFGVLTRPTGEDVRRYYEERAAARERRVIHRVARHLRRRLPKGRLL